MPRKQMTEDEKKAFAEKMKAARAKETAAEPDDNKPEAELASAEEQSGEATGQKLYTEDEVAAIAAAAAKKAVEEAMANVSRPIGAGDAVVTVMYMAEVSPENVLILPEYGSMRPNSSLDIPKKEFGGKFMSPLARKLIAKRHLIVVNGLTEDERRRWNCDYRDGELLDERAFDRLLDYDIKELADIFGILCPEHQRFVARRFISAGERGDNRVSFDKVKRLNDLSKANDPTGMFRPLMEKFKDQID